MVTVATMIGFLLGYHNEQTNHVALNTFSNALDEKTQLLPQAPVLSDFSLLDHHQQAFTLANLNRKWSLLFFGYTYCPDVCPNALMVLHKVYTNLVAQQEANGVQVIFVSVDPQRDTTEQLAEYLHYFNKDFIGVTGDPLQIEALAHQLGVAYHRITEKGNENNYLVDHSASILLVDPLGRWRATFLPPLLAERIVSDFGKIRAYYAEECCLPSAPAKATMIQGRTQ